MMPVLFIGHGNPMNSLQSNVFTDAWRRLGRDMPKPEAIVCLSAHWYGDKTAVDRRIDPPQIYDFYGFPQELYDFRYPVRGQSELAQRVMELLDCPEDDSWGVDHGAWSVLSHLYPEADVPVVMVEIDHKLTYREHYERGRLLRPLREEGVLILASGNVVHNLRRIAPERTDGFGWADEFDRYIKTAILHHNHQSIFDHPLTPAVPTADHFVPLLWALGASNMLDDIAVLAEGTTLGSISMTSYLFHRG